MTAHNSDESDNYSTAASEAAPSISSISESGSDYSTETFRSSSSSSSSSASSSSYFSPFTLTTDESGSLTSTATGTATSKSSSIPSYKYFGSLSSIGGSFGFLSSFESTDESVRIRGAKSEFFDHDSISTNRHYITDTSAEEFKNEHSDTDDDGTTITDGVGFEITIADSSSYSLSSKEGSKKYLSSVSTNILEPSDSEDDKSLPSITNNKSIGTVSEADAQTQLMANLKPNLVSMDEDDDDNKSLATVHSRASHKSTRSSAYPTDEEDAIVSPPQVNTSQWNNYGSNYMDEIDMSCPSTMSSSDHKLKYISEIDIMDSSSQSTNKSKSSAGKKAKKSADNNTKLADYKPEFERGDHVYQWCSIAGVPRVFQHHGIVMHVSIHPGDKEGEWKEELTIADFSNFLPETAEPGTQPSEEQEQQVVAYIESKGTDEDGVDLTILPPSKRSKSSNGDELPPRPPSSFRWNNKADTSFVGMGASTGGILRVYTTTHSSTEDTSSLLSSAWHKVEYGAPRWKTMISRSGISTTAVASDAPEVVLNRVNFLLVQAEREANDTFRSSILPKYHLLWANCECVATWCKTGKWSTLQGAAGLAGATWGGTMAIGRAAAAQEATAATVGLMGMAAPASWVVPAMAAYGAMAVGGSTGTLLVARSKWKATTERLNEALHKERMRATPLNMM
ncbi:expressed unknown protein [Seminavis robusta]|uniref:Uncharacterized protein n=1 Tax=Seminavis robusta TaxID=568900 RepID=A0A9N8DJ59_9STRA|nr:expressed unknown protein [Seminavis robusta]|eukprot:Sro111_g055280.1 n/a (679) ;mRNA; r:56127-58395